MKIPELLKTLGGQDVNTVEYANPILRISICQSGTFATRVYDKMKANIVYMSAL